jgi:hypothetical protein
VFVLFTTAALGPEYTSPAQIPSRAYINLGILPDGNFAVPALDASHILEMDCITGCSGSGGGGSGNQGTPASVANAWPFYMTYGGAAVSSTNKFPITSALDALITAGALQVSQSGTWTMALASGGTATIAGSLTIPGTGTTGSAVPSAALQMGFPNSSGALTSPTLNADGGVPEHITNASVNVVVASLPAVSFSGTQTVALASNTTATISAPTQQTSTDTNVSVAVNTSTVVWTTSSTVRFLSIVPNIQSCFMRQDGGTASANSTPIPGGWDWNLSEPPPNTNVTIFCTNVGNVAVHQGT